eukprot:ANDGO_02553.mRNA.1 ATP-dependent RNA helicase dhx8
MNHAELQDQRKNLPIWHVQRKLVEMVQTAPHRVTLVIGETGCGKSTQLPQFLYEAPCKRDSHKKPSKNRIVITQPRRVAAMSLASRVAQEVGSVVGDIVGYSIRFEDKTSEKTRIRFVTDGVLLRELIDDPKLSSYDFLVLDEAHERSLHTDVLFALTKQALRMNPELRVIVMSATLQADRFESFFQGASVAYIEGRQFPVQLFYTAESVTDFVDAAFTTVLQIHRDETEGDILVFMPGQEDIEALQRLLETHAARLKIVPCALYAALPSELQMRVFAPVAPGYRKVIIATNIAETSVTITGVRYVVDSGFVKARTYFARTGLDTLLTVPISRAAARQRMGRAGREALGKCYRLFTEEAYFSDMSAETIPEIKRCNLSHVILQLKSIGIDDVLSLDFMDPPPRQTLIRGLENLYTLEALDDNGCLTRLGKQMATLPLDPMPAKCLLASVEHGCLEEMLTIVAMMSVENVFFSPLDKREEAEEARAGLADSTGDHLTLLNVFREWRSSDESDAWCSAHFVNSRALKRASDVRKQLRDMCTRMSLPLASCQHNRETILKALSCGFFLNAAIRMDDVADGTTYRTLVDHVEVKIHPSSVVAQRLVNIAKRTRYRKTSREQKAEQEQERRRPTCLIYGELVLTSKKYLRTVSQVDQSWLVAAAPRFYAQDSQKPDS